LRTISVNNSAAPGIAYWKRISCAKCTEVNREMLAESCGAVAVLVVYIGLGEEHRATAIAYAGNYHH